LLDSHLRTQQYASVESAIELMDKQIQLRGEAYRARSQLAMKRGDLASAKQFLIDGTQACAGEEEPLRSLCQFLFEYGEAAETINALLQLRVLVPEDASVRHNLATSYLRSGDAGAALQCYEEALRIRPADATTHLYRGYALEQLGRNMEAASEYTKADRLRPNANMSADARMRLRTQQPMNSQDRLVAQG
jgi:Flp pilus assembly protein TadD